MLHDKYIFKPFFAVKIERKERENLGLQVCNLSLHGCDSVFSSICRYLYFMCQLGLDVQDFAK